MFDLTSFKEGDKLIQQMKLVRPRKGDNAPQFELITLTGKPFSLPASLAGLTNEQSLSIIFIDALCPMPQFPDCEQKLEQLNRLVTKQPQRQWLGIVNSYYISEALVEQFAQKFALKFPLIFDNDNRIFKAYDVYATPYQIDISQNGEIKSRGDKLH